MVDEYDGIDYSRGNPAPDPEPKWETDQGIRQMGNVWRTAENEIRAAASPLDIEEQARLSGWAAGFSNYINRRPNTRGAKSFVQWVQKNVVREPPIFSMTFGQMFEAAIAARGMHPYNSTKNQTFWTGNWMQEVGNVPRNQWPVYEGYGIVTRANGWSVIYQEDRWKGLSAGWIGGRIRHGRYSERRPGVLVRTVIAHHWNQDHLQVYPQNMGVLHAPSENRQLNDYIHLYGNEAYESSVERVIELARVVADFMNDRDFHTLEMLKREIRRHEQTREIIETPIHSGLEKKISPALLPLIGDAAVLSEQLRLGKRAYDLYKMFYTGRWDGKGWRDVQDRHGHRIEDELPETKDPDHINSYHALTLGSYLVEWLGMPDIFDEMRAAVRRPHSGGGALG